MTAIGATHSLFSIIKQDLIVELESFNHDILSFTGVFCVYACISSDGELVYKIMKQNIITILDWVGHIQKFIQEVILPMRIIEANFFD